VSAASSIAPRPRSGGGWAVVSVLWRRDLLHFARERARVFSAIAQPILFWLLLGSGFGSGLRTAGVSYSEYFFPGMVLMVVLFGAIFSTISVIEDRQQGFLRAVLAAPVPRSGVVLGKVLGSATLSFLQGAIVLALAPAAGIRLTLPGVVAALALLFLVAYALAGLGVALAWRAESTASFHTGMTFVLLPLWLLSGAVFPPAGIPTWLAWVVRLDPLTYGLEALRHALYFPGTVPIPEPGIASVRLAWALTAVFAVAAHALATWASRAKTPTS